MVMSKTLNAIEAQLILALLLNLFDQEYALEDRLIMRSDCIYPGCTVTFAECTVVGRPVGTTVWRGTAFNQCTNDELNLLHSQFGTQAQTLKCNNGSIIVQGRRVEEGCYTSELTITVSADMIGKTVQCIHYDVNREISIGTLTINYSTGALSMESNMVIIVIRSADIPSRKLTFDWNNNITKCSMFNTKYNILSFSCGSCPTTTNNTTAICTNVPIIDGSICTFRVQTVICGNTVGESVIHIALKEHYCNREESDCTGAIVSATLFAVLLSIVLCIITCTSAVLLRYKNVRLTFISKQNSPDGHNVQHDSEGLSSSTIDTKKNPAYYQVNITD